MIVERYSILNGRFSVMNLATSVALCFAGLVSWSGLVQAQSNTPLPPASSASAAKVVLPPGITEEMLAPPPVPSFMLKKPDKALTVDEMVKQAREAELKAGIKPTAKP
jgi:soluble lytic murein transglycosylase-like protein